jgi:Ca2+-binding EF-hand superfamily protein
MKSGRTSLFALGVLLSCVTNSMNGQAQTRAQREAEREQARFRAMDRDADGVITRAEWRGNAEAFTRFDTNRDGVLSGSEIWIGGRRTGVPAANAGASNDRQRQDELLESFYRADRNDDGRLARDEWWSDSSTFARVDRNHDGWITEQEFLGTENTFRQRASTPDDARRNTPGYRAGYDRGLVEGKQAGKEDKELRNQWDLAGQRELEQADSGYSSQLGLREDYQAGYRAGFRVGYRQGFGPR